ncbi:hypothetical protein B7P43_G06110 [Cryptotermes secundus]|uniref:C2H2-type domain-containing protein n=1 Tax=Cryptotermes secundus TaxID=105785 RepID=A0A2J7QQH5_9NEOP|nr:zinc finger protein 239 isoform X1 [Cryptotermes secundus]XP_023710458.1 zinc finger protein 239 isoform X1 [Cryptotermes secundus]XP_023710459.1 zinc finger protein 239 isoform X1 [Cryptotermes secundus]PNF30838.1 hypothetical protein B7P43_G06110 [Cryptotermes secundus]PNF30839.1 hypothetical protein B7P43_G06110 [Cryptotermes secundus]
MDEFKIESKSLNDSELKSPISEDANERISVVIPVVKCEAEIDLHIIKGEADTDDEIWPASSPNEDAKKEEQPAMFTFVSVNSKEEEPWNVATVKLEELATEEHKLHFNSYQKEPVAKRILSTEFEGSVRRRVHTDNESLIADSREEKNCKERGYSAVTQIKLYKCHLCHKQFHRRRNLMIHIHTHTREKTFSCDVCNKEFTEKRSLKTHLLIHAGERPFRCELCNKQFSTNGVLVRHRRVHTGEKPYACDICSKTFSQKSSLTCHVRIHTGEKPFKCEVCGKEFSNSCNVVIHSRAHTGEKPYKCEICLKVFSRFGVLAKHRRSHVTNNDSSCELLKQQYQNMALSTS